MKERTAHVDMTPENGPPRIASAETALFRELPNLINHLTVTRYDTGVLREPGWVIVKTLGCIWQVTVKDPDSCLQVSAVGITLDEALSTAEVLLAAENGPWELDRYLQKRGPQKKK